jgi:hypothetical protein
MPEPQTGRELAPREPEPAAVARRPELTQALVEMDPEHVRAVIVHAAKVARVFADAVREAGLVTKIPARQAKRDPSGRIVKDGAGKTVYETVQNEHVQEEGWAMLGRMFSVSARVEEYRPIDLRRGDRASKAYGWEAFAVARDAEGRELGADWGMVMRSESKWENAAEADVRSMAGTRASRRALRRALGWIVRLANLNTGEEDAPAEPDPEPPPAPRRNPAPQPTAQPDLDADPGPEEEAEGEVVPEPEPAAAAPGEASEEGRVRWRQVELIARTRHVPASELVLLLESLGVRHPTAPAWELGQDEPLYAKVLEAVSRYTPAEAVGA